ncbi:MerR family transcriptional regulator [Bacillus thuringiensis]|uniref:MerR family transcriptional regulator n=1 Tax=Bacillus thuringiensis TaxID=1428 RepID=UPI000A37F6DE|nr:MerR family transcriptional regulator [Bacillus thuringiensis]OUA53032.1 MerR family transcriptional regulator [Bacillus thuringiensis serovar aizawai]
MDKNYYSIGEFSERTGTSIRTLHYYDEIGLLKPEKHPRSGHRLYNNQDALILQKIVTFKFLGYSLDEISKIINQSTFDLSLNKTLEIQKKIMEEKKENIETVLKVINRTLTLLEEEKELDSTILMTLIKNIQLDTEHRKWFEQNTSAEITDILFNHPEEVLIKGDKEFTRFVKGVKKLAGKPVEDTEVQELIGKWIKVANESLCSTMSQMNEDMIMTIAEAPKEELTSSESPYTLEEEEWIERAMNYYFEHGLGATQE